MRARATLVIAPLVIAACGSTPNPPIPAQAAVTASVQPLPGYDSICQMSPSLITLGDPSGDALEVDETGNPNGTSLGVQCFIHSDRSYFSVEVFTPNRAAMTVLGSIPPRGRDKNGIPNDDSATFPNIAVTFDYDYVVLEQADCYAQYVDLLGNPLPPEADVFAPHDGTYDASAWFSVFCDDAQNTGASNPNVLVCQTAATLRFASCE